MAAMAMARIPRPADQEPPKKDVNPAKRSCDLGLLWVWYIVGLVHMNGCVSIGPLEKKFGGPNVLENFTLEKIVVKVS